MDAQMDDAGNPLLFDVEPTVPTAPGPELRDPDKVNLLDPETGDPLTDLDTGRAHLSHSAIGTLLACNRRFEFRYEQGLEKIGRPEALTLGKAFHHAIEHGDPVAGAALLDRLYEDQDDHDEILKQKAIVSGAAFAYLEAYGKMAPKKEGSKWGEPVGREFAYRIRLRSPYTGAYSRTFDLLGYADGVIDHGSYLELVEDKFVGQINKNAVKRVRLDRQVTLEAYALWRITGKQVRKVRYRFTRKPSIKQRQGENVAEFCQRGIDDYRDRSDFYLVEDTTFRDADDLLEIEEELWTWAEQVRQARHGYIFPRNTASCDDYGGCEFLDLCTRGQEASALYRPKESIPE